ncbi:MFS transporter [Nocardiopsis sp. YSL2]|uniref:MFS transporter n=1 Tax=Nocardiopsis sp. YSL2 TaxID=2939492 RepID=UPI0026F4578B|nr:MFS transporter [Nocardiopsis sp. YSL2]
MNSAPPDRANPGKKAKPPIGRNFNRFWFGSLSSNLADGLMLTALPLIAAMLTNDPLLVSLLAVARFLPWLLFGLFAGAVVDRVDRVRLMVGVNVVRAALIAGLAAVVATGSATIWVLIVVMFMAMTCEVFYDLAGRAMLPDIVRAGTIDRANGRLISGQTITEDFGGAPLAGFLFVVAASLPLAVNAGAYLVGALVLLGLPLAVRRPAQPEGAETKEAEPSGNPFRSILTEIGAGMRYTFGDASLRSLVLFGAITNIGIMAMNAVMVLLVRDHFGVPAALFGVFMSATAVGAIIGAALTGRLVARFGRFPIQVVGFLLQSLSCVVVGLAPNAYTAAAAWVLLGGIATVCNTVMVSAIQVVVPGSMLGRMMSCAQCLGYGLTPVGSLLGGLIGRIDLRFPAIFAGVLILVALLTVLPALRDFARRAGEVERAARDWEAREGQVDRGRDLDQGESREDPGHEEGWKEP